MLFIKRIFFATPYLTSQELQDAFHNSDTQNRWMVDFDSVRQSVSTQFLKKTRGWTFATIGKNSHEAIELVVDAVVTPEGLATIMEGKQKEQTKPLVVECRGSFEYNTYVNLNRFILMLYQRKIAV